MGSPSFLQGIFPTQGSNPGLPHCRQILYQLSHLGSPRILEWVAYPFSSRSSQPRNQTGISCIAGILYQLSFQESPTTCLHGNLLQPQWPQRCSLNVSTISPSQNLHPSPFLLSGILFKGHHTFFLKQYLQLSLLSVLLILLCFPSQRLTT